MAPTRSRHPSTRPAFVAARFALLALALSVVVSSGCGGAGSTPGSEPAAGTTPAPAPVAADSGATPAATGADLGAQVFAKRCALCHGAEGRGDGLASKGLNPKPRNFHDAAYMQTRSDEQLLEVIRKGKGAMPKWQGQLSEAEIAAVLQHVRSLAK